MKVAPNKIISSQKPPLNPDVNDFASAIFFSINYSLLIKQTLKDKKEKEKHILVVNENYKLYLSY